MRLQSPVQFDAVTPQLENVVENMDGGVEIQLLGDFQQSLTPKCRGLGAPKTKHRFIAIRFIVAIWRHFVIKLNNINSDNILVSIIYLVSFLMIFSFMLSA